MSFNKGCRVTTDVKLEGYERTKGEGGWGHVVYHTYADNGIKTFTGKENYDTLIQLWKKQGSNLLCKDQLAYHRKSEQKINAGAVSYTHLLLQTECRRQCKVVVNL